MRTSKQKKKSILRRVLGTLLIILLIPIVLAGGLVGYLAYTEYSPEDQEALEIIKGAEEEALNPKKIFSVMTWNIGYGDLGEESDYFMDGGVNSINSTDEKVDFNVTNMASQVRYQHPDIVFLQEVDRNSRRSGYLDELSRMISNLDAMDYSYGINHKVELIPYPWPPLGMVEAGILTGSKYAITEAARYQLPITSTWPMRMVNMKRCFTASRIPIEGMEEELVAVNLHLEAYDHGEGRAAQTEMLMNFLEKEREAGNYVIAGGDFNQYFSSLEGTKYPLVEEGNWECNPMETAKYGDSWQFIMDDTVPTCRYLNKPYKGSDPDNFQYYMTDGFIVSDNIRVMEYETKDMGFVYTDHNPVIVKLKLIPKS